MRKKKYINAGHNPYKQHTMLLINANVRTVRQVYTSSIMFRGMQLKAG